MPSNFVMLNSMKNDDLKYGMYIGYLHYLQTAKDKSVVRKVVVLSKKIKTIDNW